MELSVENFDRICRACLCESSSMKSLYTKLENNEQSLLDLFSLAANLSARTADGLPKQVCEDCEMIIHKTEEFRNRCLISDTLLKKVLQNSSQEQYLYTNHAENYKNEEENKLFMGKLSDFELDVVEKKDLAELSHTFVSEELQATDSSIHQVKKEMASENNVFENGFDVDEPLETLPIEFKEETQSLPMPHQKIFSKVKKPQWKNKKKLNKKQNYTYSFDLSCKNCNLSFEDLVSWENHLETHPSEQVTKVKKSKVNDKDISNEEEILYQCSLCFRRCKTKKTLSKHMKLHERTDNIKYSCDKCKREFKYKSFLESHVISVHMHSEYICHLCTEKLESKEALEAHIDSHKEKKKHVCSICHRAFIMLCTLKDHMRKHTGEKPFLCSTCGKGFSQKTNLAQHTRRHLGVKPFKCSICSKTFVSKGELDAHNRKHSGAHPFICDDCGNGFTTSSALVKHRRTHTGERPYACDLCPMRFAATGTLTNHRRTHTGERPFQCSMCEKAFVQRTDLISHIRCHTGERPFICSQCGQAFRKTAALKTHLKMHGKEHNGMMLGVNGLMNGLESQLSAS